MAFAHFLDDGEAVALREHEIDHGGVVGFMQGEVEAIAAIRGVIHGKARLLQAALHEPRDFFVVFDNEDSHWGEAPPYSFFRDCATPEKRRKKAGLRARESVRFGGSYVFAEPFAPSVPWGGSGRLSGRRRASPEFREVLLWCLPALLAGAIVRVVLNAHFHVRLFPGGYAGFLGDGATVRH